MPKLPNGLFKRGNSFYVRLFDRGKDQWIALGKDYEEACRRLRAIRRGEREVIARLTVPATAERWLTNYCQTTRNPRNLRMTRRRVEMYLARFFRHQDLATVKSPDLREYRLWLEERDLSPQTVAHILADARSMFLWAVDAGYLDRSPVPKRLLPRMQERPPDRLIDEEVAAVIAVEEPFGFVVRFALATGLRWGELVRAQVADVDAGMLLVAHTKSRRIRRVPVSAEIQRELRGRVGRIVPFASNSFFNHAVARKSGIARFHVHQLRHTFACRWVERGGSVAALQQILGHASIVTTQRYARISDDLVKREAERIERLASGFPGQTVAETVAGALDGTTSQPARVLVFNDLAP